MISIPFIYFSFLGILLYRRKKRFDIATIISIMFAVCGAFSILLDLFNLRSEDTLNYEISLTASITYCTFISLNLLPFIKYSNLSINKVNGIKKEKILKILGYLAFTWFAVIVVFSLSSFYRVITGDIAELRQLIYNGEYSNNYMAMLPVALRLPMVPFNYLFGCPWTLQFLAFFCLFIQKLPKKYFWFFLIASLSGPWIGILGVDRSASSYWIISFFFIFLFFKQYMNKESQKRILKLMVFMVLLLAIYIGISTVSRFGDRYYGEGIGGNMGGMITYFGQNYLNYCFLFDEFNSSLNSLSILFPFTHKLLGDDMIGAVVIQQYLSQKTGIQTGAFYTYYGHIILGIGHYATYVFCAIYTSLSFIILGSNKYKRYTLSRLYLYIALSSILFLGVFVHYYTDFTRTFSLVSFYLIFCLLGSSSGSVKRAY